MDFNTAYTSFINHLKVKNYAPSTQHHYSDMLKIFNGYLEKREICDVRQLTKKDILGYQERISKEKISRSTQALRIRAVKRFYEYLVEEDLILINPCEGIVEMPGGHTLPKIILTPSEAERIIQQPNISIMVGIRDRAILELLYSTGIRVGECEALTVYDVDTEERLVHIRHGKGGKERIVPMGTDAAKWIKEYQQRARPRSNRFKPHVISLFLSINGNPINHKMIRSMVQKYIKQAKIKKKGISCHAFRHLFATELIRNGADIVSVQKLLGHKDIRSTLVYTKVVPIDIKETHKKTHPRERHTEAIIDP
ncbi:MAG: tyrosine-type recombinase/integrase [Thermoplasmata archaeon]|nr:MAG: tyrosine-type recombinase/integrase [Thermoplasmata archaeon]